MKIEFLAPTIYWLTAAMLILMKAAGMSSLTWFWTLIPITWPFILTAGIFVATAGALAIGFVIFLIAFAIFAIVDTIDQYKIKKRRKQRETK